MVETMIAAIPLAINEYTIPVLPNKTGRMGMREPEKYEIPTMNAEENGCGSAAAWRGASGFKIASFRE